MSDIKVRQIMIYRNGSDTPISLYDKSSIDDHKFTQMISNIFSSNKISIIRTSSGDIVFKPSRIDVIEVIQNTDKYIFDNLPENEILDLKNDLEEITEGIEEEMEFDEEIIVEQINIDKVSINDTTNNEESSNV